MIQEIDTLTATRSALHRLAVHVLARRRAQVTGRIGLRASPGGLATPAFGSDPEVVRVSGTTLVHEVGVTCTSLAVAGSTLRDLAGFVGADLGGPLDAGRDTPPVGDVDTVLDLDEVALGFLASWWHLGWQVLDGVIAGLPPGSGATTVQLWPEHFDAATTVTLPSDVRINLGFSPGDGFSPEPYAYVGPWDPVRPGDPAYWNAPFGAVIGVSDLREPAAAATECRAFLEAGLEHLSGG